MADLNTSSARQQAGKARGGSHLCVVKRPPRTIGLVLDQRVVVACAGRTRVHEHRVELVRLGSWLRVGLCVGVCLVLGLGLELGVGVACWGWGRGGGGGRGRGWGWGWGCLLDVGHPCVPRPHGGFIAMIFHHDCLSPCAISRRLL